MEEVKGGEDGGVVTRRGEHEPVDIDRGPKNVDTETYKM